MSINFVEKLKKMQDIFCEGASDMLTTHLHYIHETFKDKKKANKYIRAMGLNSLDKLPKLYQLMNVPDIKNGNIKVEIKDEFKAENYEKTIKDFMRIFSTDKWKEIAKELSPQIGIPVDYLIGE